MAECPTCEQDFHEARTCLAAAVIRTCPHGVETLHPRAPFGGESWWLGGEVFDHRPGADDRCADCAVPVGGWHHPGCTRSQCPTCDGQEFGCPCCESFTERFTIDAAPADEGAGPDGYPDRLLAALRFDAQVSDTPDPLAPGCVECARR